MNHTDHVSLLREGVPHSGGRWADLGAGTGAFTLALAELLGPGSSIIAIDKNDVDLKQLSVAMCEQYPHVNIRAVTADFTRTLELHDMDGVLMANSLHFVRDKGPVLKNVWDSLKPGGRLLVVEYNVDRGNLWVPHPFSYPTWERIAANNGFENTRLLDQRPSRFLQEIYSAESIKPSA